MRGPKLPAVVTIPLLIACLGAVSIALFNYILPSQIRSPQALKIIEEYSGWVTLAFMATALYILLRRESTHWKKIEGDYHNIFDHALEGFFQCLPGGRLVRVNPALARIFGYASPEEMLGEVANISSLLQAETESRKPLLELLKQQDEIDRFEPVARRRDGSAFWARINVRLIRDEQGAVQYVEGFLKEISAEKSLSSEGAGMDRNLRDLYDNNPLILVTLDDRGLILAVNRSMEEFMGCAAADLVGKLFLDFVSETDQDSFSKQIHEALANPGQTTHLEYRIISRHGVTLWVEGSARVFTGTQTSPRVLVVCDDITEKRMARANLQMAEARYRALVEQMPAAPYTELINHHGTQVYISPQIEQMTGYSQEEWLADPELWASVLHPDDRQAVLDENKRTNESLEPYVTEYRLIAKDGHLVWLRDQAVPIWDEQGNPLYWQGLLLDISNEQKTRDALQVAEAKYRALVENIPAVVYMLAIEDGRVIYVSPQIEELTGFPASEWTGGTGLWLRAIHPEDRDRVQEEAARAEAAAKPFTSEYRMVRKDGRVIWIHDHAAMIQGQENLPPYYQGVLIETTRERQAEAAIHQSDERFRKIFQTSPIPTCITSWEDGRLLHANPAYWALSGFAPEELLGHSLLDLEFNNPENHRAFLNQLQRERSIRNVEDVFRRKNGEVRDVSIFYEIITLNDRECILAMFHDITGQKRFREDIQRREAILGSIAYAADEFLRSPRWAENIQSILEKLGQAAEASRVYIFKVVSRQEPNAVISQLFEWCAPGIQPMIDNPSLQNMDLFDSGLERWVCLLSEGRPVFSITRELPPAEQGEFLRENILSVICVPILADGQWWGLIGLDDCVKEREWSQNEVETLQTAANILSSAIQREQSAEAAGRQLMELTMLHSAAVANATAFDADELIGSVTEIISNTLKPDDCGILLVDESGRMLKPHPSYRGDSSQELEKQDAIDTGVAGMVLASRRAMRIADVRTVPEYIEVLPDIRSELCVPLISNDRVIGVINIESRELNAFDETHERLIQTIAGGLTTALEKIHLFESETRRAREAVMLREATTALTSSLDLDTLLDTTLDLLVTFAPYQSASIELVEGAGIRTAAGRNLAPGAIQRSLRVESQKWRLGTSREPIILPDIQGDARFDDAKENPHLHGWMGIPLFTQNTLIGFINLFSEEKGFYLRESASLVQTFANQAALAIQNAHLFEAELQRRREAETLRDSLADMASDLDQEQSIQRILDQLAKVVPYRTASVQLLSDGYLELVGSAGWEDPSRVLGMRFPVPGDNPNTEVIRDRRSLLLADAPDQYPPFQDDPHRHIHSWLGVPLMVRDTLLGMLAIDHSQPHFYKQEHVRMAEVFANQAAIAIANARTFQEERRRTGIIEALADIANEFATTQEMSHLLDKVAQRSLELLKASHIAIYLIQSDNRTVKIVSAKGTYSNQLISHTIQVGEGITGNVIASGKSEIVNDTRRDPRTITVPGTPREDGDIETMMSSPLILRGKAIGAINAWRLRSDGLFNESELNFLISIAHQTSISIGMSRLFEETVRRAQESAAVAQVGRDVSSTLHLDQVLQRIAEYAKDLLMSETSAVYMLDEKDGKLHGVAVLGQDADEIKNDPLILGDGIAGQIALSKTGEIVNYAASDPRAITIQGTESNPAEHIMGVPVLNKDQLTGLVVVWRTGAEHEFRPTELNFLSSLAQQAAVAIQNARSFAAENKLRLREASMLDLMRLAASSLDLDEVNQTILGHLIRLIPSDSGSIQLLKGDRLRISACIGFPPETLQRGNNLLLEDFPLNREVIESRKPIRIGDTLADERYRWIPGIAEPRSTLAFPITVRDTTIGMATLDSLEPQHFTSEDEELAMAVANHAANAIGNARLFELEQQGREEAENLRLAASAVTSSLDPQQVLETILTALRQVVPFDSGSILLLEGDKVRITAAHGLPNQAQAMNQTFSADNKLLAAIDANKNEPVILYDAQVDARFERWAAAESVRGWMGVSLVTRGEVVGYITLDSYEVGTFDERSAALARTFAYQAAAAIDNARLYQETRNRMEQLEVVGRVTFALRALTKPDEVLPVLLKEVLNIIGTDTASIWLYDPMSNRLNRKVANGWMEQGNMRSLQPNESIAGRIFRSGEAILLSDFGSDARENPSEEVETGWGGVGIPIRTSTQTIGAMTVAVPLPRRIDPAQMQLLSTLAEIAGNAIHRAQLYDQSEEQVKRLTALRDVDTAIASSFDLRVTLNILLDHTISQLRADAAAIFSYNGEMRSLEHIASMGFRQPAMIQSSFRVTGRILDEALLDRRLIHVEDLSQEVSFPRKELAHQEKFISYYAAPLISKGQIKGILEVYYRQPHPPEADWMEFFQTMGGQAAIAIDNSQLFDNLQRSNQELSLAYDTTLEGWGKALELRDRETQGHTLRVTDLTLRLARRLNVPEAELVNIRRGVLLHDIGKMAVPDHILKKSGPLDEQEWVEMRKHPQYAYDLLYPIPYLRPAIDIPYAHHERWDGEGYPNRLSREEIPLPARIFALVDVWDALLYDRPYRKAWPRQTVIDYIRGEIGTRFDPRIGDEFLRMVDEENLTAEE